MDPRQWVGHRTIAEGTVKDIIYYWKNRGNFKKAYVLGNSIVYTNFPDFNHYTVIF